MDPHSSGTDQIDTLLWIGFVAAAILIVAVNGALIYAVRRYRGARGAEASEAATGRRAQLRVGATLTVFAAIVFVLSVVYTDKANETPATGKAGYIEPGAKPLEIKATGQQWLWRYDYPNETFSYYKLVVPSNTAIKLDLVSTDVIHTWNVPSLAGKRDAVPGKVNHVIFRTDDLGTYEGDSATLSGQGYASMRTAVEVVSVPEYLAFLESQEADIQKAQDRVVGLIERGEVP